MTTQQPLVIGVERFEAGGACETIAPAGFRPLPQRGCLVGQEGVFSSQNIETNTGGRLLVYAQAPHHDDFAGCAAL